jgi:hypothetical protein
VTYAFQIESYAAVGKMNHIQEVGAALTFFTLALSKVSGDESCP